MVVGRSHGHVLFLLFNFLDNKSLLLVHNLISVHGLLVLGLFFFFKNGFAEFFWALSLRKLNKSVCLSSFCFCGQQLPIEQ